MCNLAQYYMGCLQSFDAGESVLHCVVFDIVTKLRAQSTLHNPVFSYFHSCCTVHTTYICTLPNSARCALFTISTQASQGTGCEGAKCCHKVQVGNTGVVGWWCSLEEK